MQAMGPIARASRSTVPGDSFADLAMRLMLLPPILSVLQMFRKVLFAIVMDDVQLLSHGSEREAVLEAGLRVG